MMLMVLQALVVINFAVFLRVCYLRAALRRELSEEVGTLVHQLSTLEDRFQRVSALAYQSMKALSAETRAAMKDANELLAKVHRVTEEVIPLIDSSDDKDWARASNLLHQKRSQRDMLLNWRDQLERSIQQIGGEICRTSESNFKSFVSVSNRMTSTLNELVQLGVRAAVNRVRFNAIDGHLSR